MKKNHSLSLSGLSLVKRLCLLLLLSQLLVACGKQQEEQPTPLDTTPADTTINEPPSPEKAIIDDVPSGQLLYRIGNTQIPIANALFSYASLPDQVQLTNDEGRFPLRDGDSLQFDLAGYQFTIDSQAEIFLQDLINAKHNQQLAKQPKATIEPENTNLAISQQQKNLGLLLINLDQDRHADNGIQLDNTQSLTKLALQQDSESFAKQLYARLGKHLLPPFSPTLGINLEAPQAEADTVGQAIPFADVFRTARPFRELSGANVKIDNNGWPIEIPKKARARTKLFQGTQKGAIPNGTYTVLFQGKGTIYFSGGALVNQKKIANGHFELTINTKDASNDTEANSLNVVIFETYKNNPIRNIQIIMPGGICRDERKHLYDPIDSVNSKDNPFIRASSDADCPNGTHYSSFVDLLRYDRNHVIFNPDYIRHLDPYRVIRVMNFMEASPSYPCQKTEEDRLSTCLNKSITWDQRASMDDAVWGGSARTPHIYHKGVPIEVLIGLANQLNAAPWFTMPHYVDDQYIINFASYVAQNLHRHLKPHVEYANETWNPGFWAFYYVQQKGLDEGLGRVPSSYRKTNRDNAYFARLRYYTKRSLEIFDLWKIVFEKNGRDPTDIYRILGTQQGDIVLTEEMLNYQDAYKKIDAIAMAPYFFGCINRQNPICKKSAKVLSEIETVDDIFDIIDAAYTPPVGDPSAIEGTMDKVKRQAKVSNHYGVDLVTYEGGQHLTIMGSMGELPQSEKNRLRHLFKMANRDPRMKDKYLTLLGYWRSLYDTFGNTELFTLYTSAQSYYDYGNWGIQEHLNQAREDAPKLDAVMTFQENIGVCWWKDCEN